MKEGAKSIRSVARFGLTAKGIVYCLLGILAFMAAFHINGTNSSDVDKKGVFGFVEHQPGGKILLGIIAVGLLCYSIWRFISAFRNSKDDDGKKAWGKKLRYLFSGLIYLSLAYYALRIALHQPDNSDGNKAMLSRFFDKPYGQWLAGLVALALAATGIYQCWYGLSEKYKKHVGDLNLRDKASATLLVSGKIGYLARGFVWLLLSWLLAKAAFHSNASEAGDTSTAFGYLQSGAFGPYLLGIVAAGLICYGLFNFIRARHESFR